MWCINIVDRNKDWNFWFALHIKVDSWNIIIYTKTLLNCCSQDLPYCLFVLEFYFSLCRMNIHIYIMWIYLKENEIRHLFTLWNQTFVGCHHGFSKIRMLHISAIDKEVLVWHFLARRLWFADKARDIAHRGIDLYRQEVLINLFAKDINNTLLHTRARKVQKF